MSQLYQQEGQAVQESGQRGQQTGSQMGQQLGGLQTGGAMGVRFSDVETPEERAAIQGVEEALEACGWCADQCIQLADPNMIECIRLCEDVTELAETALAVLPRRSRHVGTVLKAFEQAAQACLMECSQHQHAHCQDCADALSFATDAVQQYLRAAGQQGGQSTVQGQADQPASQQQQVQPMGQQQMGQPAAGQQAAQQPQQIEQRSQGLGQQTLPIEQQGQFGQQSQPVGQQSQPMGQQGQQVGQQTGPY